MNVLNHFRLGKNRWVLAEWDESASPVLLKLASLEPSIQSCIALPSADESAYRTRTLCPAEDHHLIEAFRLLGASNIRTGSWHELAPDVPLHTPTPGSHVAPLLAEVTHRAIQTLQAGFNPRDRHFVSEYFVAHLSVLSIPLTAKPETTAFPCASVSLRSHAEGFLLLSQDAQLTRRFFEITFEKDVRVLTEKLNADWRADSEKGWSLPPELVRQLHRAVLDGEITLPESTDKYLADVNVSFSPFQAKVKTNPSILSRLESNPQAVTSRILTSLFYLYLYLLGVPLHVKAYSAYAVTEAVFKLVGHSDETALEAISYGGDSFPDWLICSESFTPPQTVVKSRPTVMLLHGLLETSTGQFGPIIRTLQHGMRFVPIDLPGHGSCSLHAGTPYFQGSLKYARAALKAIDRGPVHLLAASHLGGPLAIHLAQEFPDRICSVTLTGITADMPWRVFSLRTTAFERHIELREDLRNAYQRVHGNRWRHTLATLRNTTEGDYTSAGLIRTEDIVNLQVPISIINGDRHPREVATVDRIKTRPNSVRSTCIAGAAHMPMLTHVEEFCSYFKESVNVAFSEGYYG